MPNKIIVKRKNGWLIRDREGKRRRALMFNSFAAHDLADDRHEVVKVKNVRFEIYG